MWRIFAITMLVLLVGCDIPDDTVLTAEPIYQTEVRLGEPISIGAAPFRTGGFPANENCMSGNYVHNHTITSGLRAGEVWLCCVPVNELLRESFSCAAGALVIGPYGYGNADDLKVQFCNLYDALSTELRYTPACIPAPLVAPGTGPDPE